MTVQDAAAQRRRLRVELKRARNMAKLTQRQVAEALDWSPSKIIRIENGTVAISTTDLRALLGHYSVKDKRRIEELVLMARGSKKQPFSDYRDVLSPEALQYFGYEASASIVRSVEPQLVQGLLQTEEYARAILKDVYQNPEERIDRLVDARVERQEILDQMEGRELFFMLDEAVIRRVVGGAGVMRRQLERLAELAARPSITIQIIPFGAGGHPGMRGPFTYLEFPDEDDDDVLYLENARGDAVFRDAPDETGPYLQTFWDLEELAADPAELNGYLQTATDKLPRADGALEAQGAGAAG